MKAGNINLTAEIRHVVVLGGNKSGRCKHRCALKGGGGGLAELSTHPPLPTKGGASSTADTEGRGTF